jgi:hypothetical protein
VVAEAVRFAKIIAANSPDAIVCTRAGLREGWETAAVERAVEITLEREFAALQKGENIVEGEYFDPSNPNFLIQSLAGLRAFMEKRKPQ